MHLIANQNIWGSVERLGKPIILAVGTVISGISEQSGCLAEAERPNVAGGKLHNPHGQGQHTDGDEKQRVQINANHPPHQPPSHGPKKKKSSPQGRIMHASFHAQGYPWFTSDAHPLWAES